jgi:hypothetical protein
MRKVTDKITTAFLAGKAKSLGNTSTDGKSLFLHGNMIARHAGEKLEVTLAGWPTVTTRERLNALPGVSINQKNHTQYLNGKVWGGEWTAI